MATVEELLQPYVESSTIEEAERALDRLADDGVTPPGVLGDCYDNLARARQTSRISRRSPS